MDYIIGIDEVGRGPVAGPIVFCACAIKKDFDVLSLFPKRELKDSKKLSKKKREDISNKIKELEGREIIFSFGEREASFIDDKGLSLAIRECVDESLNGLFSKGVKKSSKIFLDGGLKLEGELDWESVIKGDEKVGAISLASIIAKVYRDKLMEDINKIHPEYGFEKNAGYGTKSHLDAIKENGLTKYHRKSFLKNIV